MKLQRKNERGAAAIEAVLGITFFMLSILALLMTSVIVRVESKMQYALDQTARELATDYYLLDAVGIAQLTSGTSGRSVEETNKLINNVINFSGTVDDTIGDASSALSDGWENVSLEDLENFAGGAEEAAGLAQDIGNGLETLADDPAGQVKAIINVFAHTLGNRVLSYYVTPLLCKMLVPKYIAQNATDTNKWFKSVGVKVGEDESESVGLDVINFTQSSLLADGRTVELVAVYPLDLKMLTFGIIDKQLVLRQTASTAAWVTPNNGSIKTIGAAYSAHSGSEETEH